MNREELGAADVRVNTIATPQAVHTLGRFEQPRAIRWNAVDPALKASMPLQDLRENLRAPQP